MKPWKNQQGQSTSAAQSAASDPQSRAAAQGQVAAASSAQSAAQAPAPSSVTFKDGRIELVRPLIELSGHIFVDPGDAGTQVRKLTPERAFIADGVVVIEEYGIWFPLSNVTIGRKSK